MIDFLNKSKDSQKCKEELYKDLTHNQQKSFDMIVAYLSSYKNDNITEEDTYSKIKSSYRDIVKIADNEKVIDYIESLGYKDIFKRNIQRTRQDVI